MPEFQLDHGSREASARYNALDDFTQGYIEALFFTATDWSDLDEHENPNEHPEWSLADLADRTWDKIQAHCKAFLDMPTADTLLADAISYVPDDYDDRRAGRDFLFTRNGHGTGFWAREIGPAGDQLADLARTFRESNLYKGDDGRLYVE